MTEISFAVDPALDYDIEAEKDGVEVFFGSDAAGTEQWVTVARAGGRNHRFVEIAQAIEKPYRFLIDQKKLPPERRRDLNVQIFADACVRGYRGWKDSAGNEVPYSPAGARALLANMARVYEKVIEVATEADNYTRARRQEALDALGNSSTGTIVKTTTVPGQP